MPVSIGVSVIPVATASPLNSQSTSTYRAMPRSTCTSTNPSVRTQCRREVRSAASASPPMTASTIEITATSSIV